MSRQRQAATAVLPAARPRFTFAHRPIVRLLWLITVLGPIISGLVWAFEGFPPLPLSFTRGAVGVVVVGLDAAVFGSVGALLATRFPRNPIGWLLLVVGLSLTFLTPVNLQVASLFEVARLPPTSTLVMAWLMSSLLTPLDVTIVVVVLLIFPDGKFVSPPWRVAAVVAALAGALLALSSGVEPTGLVWYPALPNIYALPPDYDGLVQALRTAGVVAALASIFLAGASIWIRYRRSNPQVRLQLRWIVAGVATLAAGMCPFLIARYGMAVGDSGGEFLVGVGGVAACTFPAAIAISIVRERLFDVDALIGRTLVYVPLMGLLAGLYAASMAFFQRLFISTTGNASDGAVVMSALTLAAVFTPARSALETRVAARFKSVEPKAPPAANGRTRATTRSTAPRLGTAPLASKTATSAPETAVDMVALLARLDALEKALARMERTAGGPDLALPAADATREPTPELPN
jgi:hypothetical protein